MLAGVSSFVMGTGAFTSVQNQRTVQVTITDDDDAYLRLTPENAGGVVRSSLVNDQLTIFIPGFSAGEYPTGEGINPNATYIFEPIAEVRNQGADPIELYSEVPESLPSEFERICLTKPDGGVLDSEVDAIELSPGEMTHVGLLIETSVDADPSGDRIETTLLIRTDPIGTSSHDEGKHVFD